MKKFVEFIKQSWLHLEEAKNSNRVVAIFTIFIAITGLIYAVFAAMQWNVMRDGFIAANKPLVAINGITVHHITVDDQGRGIVTPNPTDKSSKMVVEYELKNFGTVGAESFTESSKPFVDGVESKLITLDESQIKPYTLAPSRIISRLVQLEGDYYRDIVMGKRKFSIEVIVRYKEADKEYHSYCERVDYTATTNAFRTFGACP